MKLFDARAELARLIDSSAEESAFQALFSRCPHVLSRSLPLQLHPTDIRPFGRPGQTEPDFIFYPRFEKPLSSFGVIELKRPSTTLMSVPRKNLVILSRDAASAIGQAQQYCTTLQNQLAYRLTRNLVMGAADYIFVIAGLTDEFARKIRPAMLRDTLDALLPPRCNILPYDELLRRFESSLPPRILYFSPIGLQPLQALEELLSIASVECQQRRQINDDNMTFWSTIEDRWRAGGYIGSNVPRIIDRPYWVVSGTDVLAPESPAHLEFPLFVDWLVETIRSSLKLHTILARAQSAACKLDDLEKLLTPSASRKLTEAVERCRRSRRSTTWIENLDADFQLMERLGLMRLGAESGDLHCTIDPLLIRLWRTSEPA